MTPSTRHHPSLPGAAAALLTLTLAGCGGGGGDGGTPASAVLKGRFIDAPVEGLCYTASPSGINGMTSADGSYAYRAGDHVAFGLPTGGNQCATGAVALGSVQPKGDATASATTFVLELANGRRVADVLNALNHASSGDSMKVGSLTVPAATAQQVGHYIAQGAPAGAASTALLAQVQKNTTAPAAYALPVTDSFHADVDRHLAQSASSLPASTQSAADLVGTLSYRSGAHAQAGMYYLASATQMAGAAPLTEAPRSRAVTLSGATLTTNPGGKDQAQLTLTYRTAEKFFFSEKTADGATRTDAATVLQPLLPAHLAGKTLTFQGAALCNGKPIDAVYAFSADGSTMQRQGAGGPESLRVAADPVVPGALRLTTAAGSMLLLGQPKNATLTPGGTLVFVTAVRAAQEPALQPTGSLNLIANPAQVPVCTPA